MASSETDDGVEPGAGDAADDRSDDGNPAVRPVRRSLPRDRKNRMHEARAEIAGGIEGVTGRAAERKADAEDEHADEQRLQAAAEYERQVDVARLGQGLRVRGDRQDAEHQDRRADDLGDAVPGGVADGRAGRKGAEL